MTQEEELRSAIRFASELDRSNITIKASTGRFLLGLLIEREANGKALVLSQNRALEGKRSGANSKGSRRASVPAN